MTKQPLTGERGGISNDEERPQGSWQKGGGFWLDLSLNKGLKTSKKHVASHKTQLKANLKAGNIISADDEEWLDA